MNRAGEDPDPVRPLLPVEVNRARVMAEKFSVNLVLDPGPGRESQRMRKCRNHLPILMPHAPIKKVVKERKRLPQAVKKQGCPELFDIRANLLWKRGGCTIPAIYHLACGARRV